MDDDGEDGRKLQNRIAQREFRKRKNQHLKDLEARIALYDSGDEQVIKLRAGMRALLEENSQLRSLLVKLSGFVGAGLGGELVKSGIDITDFNHLLAREKTDIVHDALAELDMNSQTSPPSNATTTTTRVQPQQQSQQSQQPSPTLQRFDSNSTNYSPIAGPSNLFPPPITIPTNSYLSASSSFNPTSFSSTPTPTTITSKEENFYPSVLQSTTTTTTRDSQTQSPDSRSTTSQEGIGSGNSNSLKDLDFKLTREFVSIVATSELGGNKLTEDAEDFFNTPTDNAKIEAIQLISYHMKNKHTNPSYHLPPALRATVVQETIPHSPLLDGIIIPSLRDRLILSQDQYDVQILIADLIQAFSIHSNDVLLSSSWEISEYWMKKYWFCISNDCLSMSNRWRILRGELPLEMNDLLPQ